MIGRDLCEVEAWSIVPPAASVTLCWGAGGCALHFEDGELRMGPGDWMWVDAGLAHRGENVPGSDFLTVFVPEHHVRAAALDVAPIGAASEPAPPELADMLMKLAVALLDGERVDEMEGPVLDAVLDRIGTVFAPKAEAAAPGDPIAAAAAMLRGEPRADIALGDVALGDVALGDVADAVGVSASDLSRRFARRYHLTPIAYRRQLRLVLATRALARGASVIAAAHGSGFADAAHLTRTFKAQYGVTPSRWAASIVGRTANA